MILSPDQQKALDFLLQWYKAPTKRQYITLGGYAGTGKTTLMSALRTELKKTDKNLKIAFCSFTGKASRVLRSKIEHVVSSADSISTIHSLIYSPVENSKHEIVGWELKRSIGVDMIVVDEASMVNEEIWKDLLSYKLPIIAVGDHGQLPPIGGSFNLMSKLDIRLEKIHRQAEDNPIIRLSMLARTEGKIPFGHFAGNVMKIDRTSQESKEIMTELLQDYNQNTLVLCGYNNTRIRLNKYIRGFADLDNDFVIDPEIPRRGDRVICLRNNHEMEIYNGMLGTIRSISPEEDEWFYAKISMDDGIDYAGLISSEQFNLKDSANFTDKRSKYLKGDLFDFGYALTVHKAQGSQAKRVILFEERFKQMTDEQWKKWLYTAVTRAEEELFIFG